ncbi:MAG: hypothetical protein N3A53_00190 [Verrucomicrobiae bacterium]|nr:hypothetical protein [Verrucomicrobiae bacterium]MDW8343809.1 hypothetical protein [Verrucomicrobiae bacterium]
MKRIARPKLTLRDLIEVVSRYTRNDHETAIWVDALLRSGLVRLAPAPQRLRDAMRHGFG